MNIEASLDWKLGRERGRQEARCLVDALQFYADGQHIMKESEPAPCNVCPPTGHHAREALEEYRGKT